LGILVIGAGIAYFMWRYRRLPDPIENIVMESGLKIDANRSRKVYVSAASVDDKCYEYTDWRRMCTKYKWNSPFDSQWYRLLRRTSLLSTSEQGCLILTHFCLWYQTKAPSLPPSSIFIMYLWGLYMTITDKK